MFKSKSTIEGELMDACRSVYGSTATDNPLIKNWVGMMADRMSELWDLVAKIEGETPVAQQEITPEQWRNA